MPLIIADTLPDSLEKLTKQEQSAVKQTAFDLQVNPDNPGLSFHRIDKPKETYFWSVRDNRDLRVTIHKRGISLPSDYVNHHDDAYEWAEKRRHEVYPRTGAVQILVLRERVEHRADWDFSDPACWSSAARNAGRWRLSDPHQAL